VDHVAWADFGQQFLGVAGVRGILHRVEVIQVAEELVEAVDGGQELILVAKMVLTELAGGVALRFERGGDRAGFRGQTGGRGARQVNQIAATGGPVSANRVRTTR